MALANCGHQVTYVASATGSFDRSHLPPTFNLDTSTVNKFVPIFSLLRFALFAGSHIMKTSTDVIIVNWKDTIFLLPFLLLSRFLTHPILFLRVESNPVELVGIRSSIFSTFYELMLRINNSFFDRLLFISPMLADLSVASFHLSRSKVGVWPSTVDTGVFDPTSIQDESKIIRRRLKLPYGPLILYHGALTEGRGVFEAVKALELLNVKSVKARLLLLGDGSAKSDIIRYIKAKNLEDIIRVRGPVKYGSVPEYIAACDVELVPLPDNLWWRYQCPFKVLETLAMNKPVILSNIACHRWIAGGYPGALFLDGTSAREIARGIARYLRKRNTKLHGTGREIALRFSSQEIAKTIESEIAKIKNMRTTNKDKLGSLLRVSVGAVGEPLPETE
jgi:glycosyltransferase involved in cell wall biosynthesis